MSSLPRILMVDDERDNIDALKRLLRKDFEMHAATSGAEALDIMHRVHDFDVILSDQRMPGMNGSEFLEKAQQLDSLATRVLLTGFADLEAVIEAVNRGHIWRYLSKPWEPEELKQALKQAAERTRMSRSLETSRRDLERALMELRARDSSRERLLQILLHEFRTAPQILEGLRALDPNDADTPVRQRFFDSLYQRFNLVEKDITTLLAEEKRITQLPKEALLLSEVLRNSPLGPEVSAGFEGTEPSVIAHRDSLLEAFVHLRQVMQANTAQAPVGIALELSKGQRPDMFVTFTLNTQSTEPILPASLAQQKIEPRLAWSLLLEPFMGVDDFSRHSTGLRIETARIVRLLTALGARAEFQVSRDARRVELILAFKTA
ncbi:MAG: response regulator [Bdellovibrionales bacterium]|nr:response regulator [Bdellovibrionales bacterium]